MRNLRTVNPALSRRRFVTGLASGAAVFSAAQADTDPSRPFSLLDVTEGIKPGSDVTAQLERAIQIAQAKGIGQVLLPAGEYVVQSVKMRSKVKLKGMGRGATHLKAATGYDGSFIVLANGPIVQTAIEGLSLVGGTPASAVNPGQWAIDFEAKPIAGSMPANGGFWWSYIQDVQVTGFSRGVRFQGGAIPGNYQLPHQFNSFRDFVVYLSKDAKGPALKIAGQAAQFSFDQCHFDHNGGMGDFTLVEIGKVGETSGSAGPDPSMLRFNVCTFQDARLGVDMADTQNVAFESCWFEQLRGGIQVGKDCVGTTITGCRFANAGSALPAVAFLDNAHGTVSTNVFAGSQTRQSIRAAPESRVVQTNNIQTLGAGQ